MSLAKLRINVPVLKNLAIVLCSVCLMLLAMELAVRYRVEAWPFERSLYVPPHLTPLDAPLRWRYSPGNGRNSLGLRNREVGPKKNGIYRILVVGDSLVWSGETSSGELYTEVLERRLNSLLATGTASFEVINAGIPGYTTFQELEFLRIYGMKMEPDLVILGFVFNDNYKYLHRPTRRGLLDSDASAHLYRFNPYTFPGILLARSYLAHIVVSLSEMSWKRLLRRPVFPFERRTDFYLAWKEYGWIDTHKLIGQMKSLVTAKGASLVVMVFPIRDQVDDEFRKLDEAFVLYPQTMIRRICDDYAIPMLDLTDPIYKNGGVGLFKDYLHLNPRGNDLVAYDLENFLVKKLDPCGDQQ
jgi:lysophospholipase L1-like esterase